MFKFSFPQPVKAMTKEQAIEQNRFYEVTPTDDVQTLHSILTKTTTPYLYVIARNKRHVLLDLQSIDVNMITVLHPDTGEILHYIIPIENVMTILLNDIQYPEYTDETLSVFLDETNMEFYSDLAATLAAKYKDTKIENMTITGNQYLEKTKQMIQVAHDLINGKLIPDLFQKIPGIRKKDHTFTENRKIPIFKNNLYDAENCYDYVNKSELVLCIVTHGTWDFYQPYDMSQTVSPTRARLALTDIQGAKKIYPLLNKDLSVNDIVSKTRYLKQDQICPGGIYQEKSGTNYLYLGNISILNDESYDIQKQFDPNDPQKQGVYTSHCYIRMTKKIQRIIDESPDMDIFLQNYIKPHLNTDCEVIPLSTRMNPRKFVAEINIPYPTGFSRTNDPSKPLFSIETTDYITKDDITMDFYILENRPMPH